MERLQKVIAQAGVASRRKTEELIAAGKVTVNGQVVTTMGFQVGPQDIVKVNGKELQREEKVYFVLNKPKNMICSLQDDKDRKTILSCFPDVEERIFPVGRLDYATTGLIFVTNDGAFANKMMHPRSHIRKTYEVTVDGYMTDAMLDRLAKGVDLEDGKTLPAEVVLVSRSTKRNRTELVLTIQEGRNREIRRMIEYFHFNVTRLNRISYGCVELGNLRQGEFRRLRMYEVKKLMRMADQSSMPF